MPLPGCGRSMRRWVSVRLRDVYKRQVYVNVLQLAVAAPLAHGLDQALRSAGHAAQMDVVMAFDCPDGLLGRDEMDRFGHCV